MALFENELDGGFLNFGSKAFYSLSKGLFSIE